MFVILLSKEVRFHFLTFKFTASLVTTFSLVLLSVWVLSEDYIRRRDTFNITAERAAAENLEVYVPSQISPTLLKPPSPLGIFAQGEERRFGNSVEIKRWEVPRRASGSLSDNELLRAEPPFDLLTVFTLVISIFAVVITYDLISGERESGTLRLLNTGSAGRSVIFAAKFISGVICISIPFLFSFLAGLLVISFVFNIAFTAPQWSAIAMMMLVGLAFAAFFVAVGLACSALVRGSASALILSLLTWALGILVIPGAGRSIAEALEPIPSEKGLTSLAESSEQEIMNKLMTAFFPKHPDAGSGWTGWDGESYYVYDGTSANFRDTEELVRFHEPLMLERARRLWEAARLIKGRERTQAALIGAMVSPSPAFQLRSAFTALAGTDVNNNDRFIEEARVYRRNLLRGFQERGLFGRNALEFFTRRSRAEIDDDLYAGRSRRYDELRAAGRRDVYSLEDEWGKLSPGWIPGYSFNNEEPGFQGAVLPLVYFVVGTALFFMLGIVAFQRYDVR